MQEDYCLPLEFSLILANSINIIFNMLSDSYKEVYLGCIGKALFVPSKNCWQVSAKNVFNLVMANTIFNKKIKPIRLVPANS